MALLNLKASFLAPAKKVSAGDPRGADVLH
jgi:hypothetical protein